MAAGETMITRRNVLLGGLAMTTAAWNDADPAAAGIAPDAGA